MNIGDDLNERAARAARDLEPKLWIEHVESGYHTQLERTVAEFLLATYPHQYRRASGPDNKPPGEWEMFDGNGELIAASYPLPGTSENEEQPKC